MTTLPKNNKLVFPSKEELIGLIRMMDPDEEEVVINLNKCNFDATADDVMSLDKGWVRHIKHYKPGSFALTIRGRVNAIRFIEHNYKGSLLGRPFYIKMGFKHVGQLKHVGQSKHNSEFKRRNFQEHSS